MHNTQGLIDLVPQLSALQRVLPPATLAWRLELLRQGCAHLTTPRLAKVQQRALVVAGERDLLIPSAEEAERLVKALPRCRKVVLPGRSHAVLQEAGVDLVQIMQVRARYVSAAVLNPLLCLVKVPPSGLSICPLALAHSLTHQTPLPPPPHHPPKSPPQSEGFYVTERVLSNGRASVSASDSGSVAFGTPAPIPLPTLPEIKADGQGFVQTIRRLCSPVYYSTLPDGTVVQGFDGLPRREAGGGGRPVLFIGNHQLFAADMYTVGLEVAFRSGVIARAS
jgi:hypothetical protein